MRKAAPRTLTSKFWWAQGWWGDQGATSQCVAYSWLHWTEDGPVTHPRRGREIPLILPGTLYAQAQARDPWAHEPHDGTTVRAGVQALQQHGYVVEYRWAFDIETAIDWLLTKGPMVFGTTWYDGMMEPDKDGFIHATGEELGGHAYVIDGVNRKAGYARIKNSWGREWGENGFAKISLSDLEKLLKEWGAEACTAVEKRAA